LTCTSTARPKATVGRRNGKPRNWSSNRNSHDKSRSNPTSNSDEGLLKRIRLSASMNATSNSSFNRIPITSSPPKVSPAGRSEANSRSSAAKSSGSCSPALIANR
jgi:hypothetical protein